MKKRIKVILTILLVGFSVEPSTIEATDYSYDIKDEFRFSSKHSFDVVKDDKKAEAKIT
ncbi:hypothetical protein ACTQ5R_09800 [Ruoffia tabacinasalis]|uniref:hypothetical protein n=1 Tax=Ruoffia tabacinasalis TaxID=87458 RepID=UPI003F992CEB